MNHKYDLPKMTARMQRLAFLQHRKFFSHTLAIKENRDAKKMLWTRKRLSARINLKIICHLVAALPPAELRDCGS
jgi:hypothetical protein